MFLCRLFVTHLAGARHANGSLFSLIYGAHSPGSGQPSPGSPGAIGQGPVVTFNLLRPDGSYVGYRYALVTRMCKAFESPSAVRNYSGNSAGLDRLSSDLAAQVLPRVPEDSPASTRIL